MGDMAGGWWMVVGWTWMIGVFTLAFWAVSALIRTSAHGSSKRRAESGLAALNALSRCHANGEIGDEPFDRMHQRLPRPSGTQREPDQGFSRDRDDARADPAGSV